MATSVGDYKVDIPNAPEVTGRGNLKFDGLRLSRCVSTGPIVWQEVAQGRSISVALHRSVLEPIYQSGQTDAQKRNAVLGLVIERLKEMGLAESHDAFTKFIDLLPNDEWPTGGYSPIFSLD